MATKTRRTKKAKKDVYQDVTNRILAAIDSGVHPWEKPWIPILVDRHRNFARKNVYHGINILILDLAARLGNYSYPYWLSYKQAQDMGGQVRGGEKSTIIVIWKPFEVEEEDKDTGEMKKVTKFYFNEARVFNVEQCDGLELPPLEEVPDFEPIDEAAKIVKGMPKRPSIQHGWDHAGYAPFFDHVEMPNPEHFKTSEDYYRTLFHEFAHSTGHEKRLHRVKDWGKFGSEPYAQEELVAELCSAMLAGVARIEGIDQSAAYLDHWRDAISKDKKLIIMAAAQASRAADFILGEKTAQPNGTAA